MRQEFKDFIGSIDNSLYNKIRQSKSDAECRRYLREHLEDITVTYSCKSDSELLTCDNCKHNCLVWDDNYPCATCAEMDNYVAR